jgi:NAD(P)H-flavin reductase
MTYDASSDIVHLDVPCQKSLISPKPGTYYYIYVLNDLLYAHQNHPFTLAYVKSSNAQDEQAIRQLSTRRHLIHAESNPLLSSTSLSSASTSIGFLIRPYHGFTSRLARKVSVGPTALSVLIEGPYGYTAPLQQYPNVLFVVGGTGIAVPLSYLAILLSEDSIVITMRIVWAVRERAFLASILDMFRELLEDERVYLEVHVTQNQENRNDITEEQLKRVMTKAGRPDVHAVVENAAVEAGCERLAVMACGPAQMADQVRGATVNVIGRGFCGINYFEESFKW